jgi:AraC family transcriptional regulator
MRHEEPGTSRPAGVLAALRPLVPFEASASSEALGWVGLEAARYSAAPGSEVDPPPLPYHWLVLITRPPVELDLRYEGVERHVPPPAGSMLLVPAGCPVRWRWRGCKDSLHVHLDPALVARVAAEVFDLDPARLTVPPLDGLDVPQLRAAMGAIDAELSARDAAGPLAAESLANVVAVHLVRHVMAPRRPARTRDGVLPRGRLRAVVDYIEAHLDTCPTLDDMAAVARVSPYHFARQFKAATGLPPHQYVIARRVERAKQFLQGGGGHSLAAVAAQTGFSDQSQFCQHFKRLVGVTPGQFRMSARIA